MFLSLENADKYSVLADNQIFSVFFTINNVNYRIDNFNTLDFSPSNLLSHIQQPTNNKNKNNSNGKAKKTKLNVKKTNKYIHYYKTSINSAISDESLSSNSFTSYSPISSAAIAVFFI